jgi:hypothetical protein
VLPKPSQPNWRITAETRLYVGSPTRARTRGLRVTDLHQAPARLAAFGCSDYATQVVFIAQSRGGHDENSRTLGRDGSLSDQDAINVAEFVTHQPRRTYAATRHDFASGSKSKDARN